MITMNLTADEARVIERLRKTPAERRALLEARRQRTLAKLPERDREVLEAVAGMPDVDRRAYVLLQQQDRIAKELERPELHDAVNRVMSFLNSQVERARQ